MTATPLPPENAYGHRKKLAFFLDAIARHRAAIGRRPSVLDFGCGNGTAVSRYLIEAGVRYVGVDFHEPSLAHARDAFSRGDARFLPAVPEGDVFDVILYSDVLEHLPDPAAVLGGHVGRLASDGILLASIPNGFGGFEIERWLDRNLRIGAALRRIVDGMRRLLGRPRDRSGHLPYNSENGHVVFFTRSLLNGVLADAGLVITEFRHGSFVGADLSGSFVIRGPLVQWNTALADHLPHWAVSTWHFAARRDSGGQR